LKKSDPVLVISNPELIHQKPRIRMVLKAKTA
jgi:hypothetical protein